MEHFINHTKPTVEHPTILILDNHECHVSIPAIIRAKEVGIILLTFHPHTSHKMQPLDRTVFGLFKKYYNTAVNEWMLSPGNAGKPVTIYEVAEFVGKAYPLSFTPNNIISGFHVTGLIPLNENIFEVHEFLTSNVTNRPEVVEPISLPEFSVNDQAFNIIESSVAEKTDEGQSTHISPETIKPFPRAEARKPSSRGRKKGRSLILTDTPEKNEIEVTKTQKKMIPDPKLMFQKKSSLKTNAKKSCPLVQRKVFKQSSSSSSGSSTDNDDMSSDSMCDFDPMEELQEQEEVENETLEIGNYVLIKFAGKSTVKYFVAMTVDKDEEFIVKYLKRQSLTNKFSYDENSISYSVANEDIILKLPSPNYVNCSSRRQPSLSFSIDFSLYNVQ